MEGTFVRTYRFSTLKISELPKPALPRAPGRLCSYGFGICGPLSTIAKKIKFQVVSFLLLRLALYYGLEVPFCLNWCTQALFLLCPATLARGKELPARATPVPQVPCFFIPGQARHLNMHRWHSNEREMANCNWQPSTWLGEYGHTSPHPCDRTSEMSSR